MYVRGVKFLLKSQSDTGTWHVASHSFAIQPYFDGGFPYEHDQWISQQGSAFAMMALENVFETTPK